MSTQDLFIGLLRLFGQIALLVLAYSVLLRVFDGRRVKSVAMGCLLALGGGLSMADPLVLAPGAFSDGRTSVIAVSYLFAGTSGTLIVAGVLSAVRFWLGGAGTVPGIISILIAAAATIFLGKVIRLRDRSVFSRVAMLSVITCLPAAYFVLTPAVPGIKVAPFTILLITLFKVGATLTLDLFLLRQKRIFAAQRFLETQATTDPLTRLNNRRAFDEAARRALALDTSASVIMFDIDHFKAINDTFGHQAGDEVLREVADIVSRSVRAGDIVARYGGEEIIVLIAGADLGTSAAIADTVRRRIERQIFGASPHLKITISAGTASRRSPQEDLDTIIKRADAALYTAKRNGRNRVEFARAA